MILTPLLARPERVTIAFKTETSEEAITAAKEWVRAAGGMRIKTLCSVKRHGDDRWAVELAVRWLA